MLSLSDFSSVLIRLLTLDVALSDAVYFGCCYRGFSDAVSFGR